MQGSDSATAPPSSRRPGREARAPRRTRSRAQVPPERVTTFHLDPPTRQKVVDWFSSDGIEATCDGERAVILGDPDRTGRLLKIKGAGLNGGAIRFGTPHASRLKAPAFDFDGRMMEDVASGHDNAWLGGASFQQAVTEHRITATLAGLGIPVVPCLGYGHVDSDTHRSWFSVFEWGEGWRTVLPPAVSLEEMAEASERRGRMLVDLACHHDLIGYSAYMSTPDQGYLVKDLHPFRQADPVNMSQLSWAMQLLFCLHIPVLAAMFFARRAGVESLPDGYQASGFRGVLADATSAEHEALRWTIIAPYMLNPAAAFDPLALHAALRRNRIGNALLELCPAKYARF